MFCCDLLLGFRKGALIHPSYMPDNGVYCIQVDGLRGNCCFCVSFTCSGIIPLKLRATASIPDDGASETDTCRSVMEQGYDLH
jgi:hypothetical protein